MSTPDTLDLTLAASMLVAMEDVGGNAASGARAVWSALTGLDDAEAVAYARTLATDERRQTAAVVPF